MVKLGRRTATLVAALAFCGSVGVVGASSAQADNAPGTDSTWGQNGSRVVNTDGSAARRDSTWG